MNKTELMRELAARAGSSPAEARKFMDAFLDILGETAESGGSVRWKGLGRFYVNTLSARRARNPQTGGRMTLPARSVLRFAPSADLAARARTGGAPEAERTEE